MVTREVDNDKDIAGEQWRNYIIEFLGMPDCARESGDKATKSKALEIETRAIFPMRERMCNKPTLTLLQI